MRLIFGVSFVSFTGPSTCRLPIRLNYFMGEGKKTYFKHKIYDQLGVFCLTALSLPFLFPFLLFFLHYIVMVDLQNVTSTVL